jgi:PAB-dependent poly(A)-specific ribonuclease subunit 3
MGHPSAGISLNALADDFDPNPLHISPAYPSPFGHRAGHYTPTEGRPIPSVGSSWPTSRRRKRRSGVHFPITNRPFQAGLQGNGNGPITSTSAFDPFVTTPTPLSAGGAVGPVQPNPYSHDGAAALGGAAFFPGASGFQQPVSFSAVSNGCPCPSNVLTTGPISFVRSYRPS